MQRHGGARLYAASDLVNFIECEHLTALDLLHLDVPLPRSAPDESAELRRRKGDAHERGYLQMLRASARQVVDIAAGGGDLGDRAARTLQAMRSGVEVVYQATLIDRPLLGHADFLRRVDRPSALGGWSYEVADTKLARQPKAKFLVQLAFYSHLLECAQGAAPLAMHVVLGDHSERHYRCADYMHHFRALLGRFRARVEADAGTGVAPSYPLPCAHCELCHWRERCEAQREADDHLCLVADIRRTQIARLQAAGISTMAGLGALADATVVPRMQPDTLARLRAQAALQSHARRTGERRIELLPAGVQAQRGLSRLPRPDDGDLYFDMEGDPYEEGGLEYLFGVGYREAGEWCFRAFWAHDRAQERDAFERFIDFASARRAAMPGAHVYHYAAYENTALKRLAALHATREVEVDNLLRDGALVDLYKVVRESMRISEPSYSIKSVERFYRPVRAGQVRDAGASIVWYERWRDTGDDRLLGEIEAYNRDDVESTRQLHDWLLSLRPAGLAWAPRRRAPPEAGAAAALTAAEQRLLPYRRVLVDAWPADRGCGDDRIAELAYQLLDFHRRAEKPAWWAMYARMEMDEHELVDDVECLAGLRPDPEEPPRRDGRSIVHTCTFPEQETKLGDGDRCTRCDTGESLGELAFDQSRRRVRLRVGPTRQPLPARLSVGPDRPVGAKMLTDALFRFADSLIDGGARHAALGQLLRREPPRLHRRTPGQPIVAPGADPLQGTIEAVRAMDGTCLFVQGPPGAGKTHAGAHVIVDLLARGQRVGVTSNSHKAINHLLSAVVRVAQEKAVSFAGCRKATDEDGTRFDGPMIDNAQRNADVLGGNYGLIAGTAWLFADPRAERSLDVLFVDEAGQVALANLVAMGMSARNLVLLGDQMQLGQPIQGVHPGRSGESSLEYLLDGEATIRPDRGILLATSWRLHPDLCRFVSEAVYDGRLQAEPGNARRALVLDAHAHPLLRPAGLVYVPVVHAGNAQSSEEEASLVCELVEAALAQRCTDRDGLLHPLTLDRILVVAPYNMQVNLLASRLPRGARVGTVDRFQGQEAELVIVSMATSSEQDLPRHLEFLYSRNRLNVAITRARCLAIVIASPALLAIRCTTPEQMALVNTLCWVAEAGQVGPGGALDASCRGSRPHR